MTLLQAIFLGAVQGLTEFIPISSSGHLLLISWLLGWPPPSLVFEVAVHWGTVLAVLAFFWRDWLALIRAGVAAARQRSLADPQARLLSWVLAAAIPAMLVGFFFETYLEQVFKAPVATAILLLVTALLLALGERLSKAEHDLSWLNWPSSLSIGIAQAISILPGISRSGATIAAGRWRGLSREAAARFSFLLATPTILGAALWKMIHVALAGELVAQAAVLAGGATTAALVGYFCIGWLMRHLRRGSLVPFAIYCTVAGIGWLVVAFASGRL